MLSKRFRTGQAPALLTLICAVVVTTAYGADEVQSLTNQSRNQDPLFLTATNGANNFLAVINTRTKEMDFVPTGGLGGASGNAGGIDNQPG